MSTEFSFDSGHVNADHGFTIKRLEGCRIVTGPVPLSEFQMLIHGFSDNAVMAADLASKMGPTFVIGEPDDIERLRQCNLPVSPERIRDCEEAKKAGLPAGVVDWLLNGERGRSPDAMCKAFFGIPSSAGNDYPLDPSDLRRCLQFLEAVDDKEMWRFDVLHDLSLEWYSFCCYWPQLVTTFKDECAKTPDPKMPKTYELMKHAIAMAFPSAG